MSTVDANGADQPSHGALISLRVAETSSARKGPRIQLGKLNPLFKRQIQPVFWGSRAFVGLDPVARFYGADVLFSCLTVRRGS